MMGPEVAAAFAWRMPTLLAVLLVGKGVRSFGMWPKAVPLSHVTHLLCALSTDTRAHVCDTSESRWRSHRVLWLSVCCMPSRGAANTLHTLPQDPLCCCCCCYSMSPLLPVPLRRRGGAGQLGAARPSRHPQRGPVPQPPAARRSQPQPPRALPGQLHKQPRHGKAYRFVIHSVCCSAPATVDPITAA